MTMAWQDLATLPYDEIVLLYHESGNVQQGVWYDEGLEDFREQGWTHWMPLPPPPD